MRDRLIFALDVPDLVAAQPLVERLAPEVGMIKVGLELFVAEGPPAARMVRDRGCGLFLDLKLCDVPETVGRAVGAAARLGAAMLTVHATGGEAMLRRAVEVGTKAGVAIVAVTVLTSLDDPALGRIGLSGPCEATVLRLAKLAQDAGCAGVVASPLEAAEIRAHCGRSLQIVTPGIRAAGAPPDDQRRTASAAEAVAAGADYLVVGRPIRDAVDPVAAARAIVGSMTASVPRSMSISRA